MVNYLEGVARAYAIAHGIHVPVLHAAKPVEGPVAFVAGLHPTRAHIRSTSATTSASTAAAADAARPSTLASARRSTGASLISCTTGGTARQAAGPKEAVADAPGTDADDMSESDDDDDDEAVYAVTYDDRGVNGDGDGDDDDEPGSKGTANNSSFESSLHTAITRLVFKLAAPGGFDQAFAVQPKGSTKKANGITPDWLTDQFWVVSPPPRLPAVPASAPASNSATGGAAAAATTPGASGTCTTWQLITNAMGWASVRTQAGFLADLHGLTEALRVPADLHQQQVGGPSKVPAVFLPGGQSIQYITECLVKLAGCRVLSRARACAKRLHAISTVLFFEWVADAACHVGELAICATTTLAAASAALNVGGGVKKATDLLVADTPECKAFRRNVSVATCLAAHRADLLSGVAAGVMDIDTVDGVASLVSYLHCQLATLQEKRRAQQVAGNLLTSKATRLDAALAALMEKRDVWATVLPPPTEPLRVLHCPVDWGRFHGLVGAATGSYGQPGSIAEFSVYRDVKGEKCVASRYALLEAVLTTEEVDRVTAQHGDCISFTTNGLTLNLRVQRATPSTPSTSTPVVPSTSKLGAGALTRGPEADGIDASARLRHEPRPVLAPTCALANVQTMTTTARNLLGDDPLTRFPFLDVGAAVFAECNGDFTALSPERRLHVGDIALVCAGIDPTRPGRYSESTLRYPLAQGPCPAAGRQRHLWLLAVLRAHDERFQAACDPGLSAPLTFVNTARVHDAFTRSANKQPLPDNGKRRFQVKQIETFRPRAQKGCVHRVYVSLAVLKNAVEVVNRPGDPWRRFGPVVTRPPAGNTAAGLCPGQAQLEIGDHILRVHNHTLLATKQAEAIRRWHDVMALVTTMHAGPPQGRRLFEVDLCRPAVAPAGASGPRPAVGRPEAHAAPAPTPGQYEKVSAGDADGQQRPAVSPTSAGRLQHEPPMTPGATTSTAFDSSQNVGLALSAGAVKAALGVDAAAEQAQLDGRALWPNPAWAMATRQAHIAHLQEMLNGGPYPLSPPEWAVATRKLNDTRAAIAAQLDLHLMTKYNTDIQAAQLAACAGVPMGAASAALAVAVAGADLVFRQFYRPSRVRAAAESGRRHARLIDRTVEQSVAFINGGRKRRGGLYNGATGRNEVHDGNHADDGADGTFDQDGHDSGLAERMLDAGPAASTAEPPGLQPQRVGVVVVGDWVVTKKPGGSFAFQAYLKQLARHVIVLIGSENCTSKLCCACGDETGHPLKRITPKFDQRRLDRGTTVCTNYDCPSRGKFLNRDLQGATNIGCRFLLNVWGGGQLGTCMPGVRAVVGSVGVGWLFRCFFFRVVFYFIFY